MENSCLQNWRNIIPQSKMYSHDNRDVNRHDHHDESEPSYPLCGNVVGGKLLTVT